MEEIEKASEFARKAHEGQRRKYYDADYIVHPEAVRDRLSELGMPSEVVTAGVLHDVPEDCYDGDMDKGIEDIKELFGERVAALVFEVTNPSKNHPELDRAAKKAMDREHLATVSRYAKIIKLVDRIDNLNDMEHPATPKDFLKTYVFESKLLAMALCGVHSGLEIELHEVIAKIEKLANE